MEETHAIRTMNFKRFNDRAGKDADAVTAFDVFLETIQKLNLISRRVSNASYELGYARYL